MLFITFVYISGLLMLRLMLTMPLYAPFVRLHSMILNPHSAHYSRLRSILTSPEFTGTIPRDDIYFPTEAMIMEYNSRDFIPRMRVLNRRAELLVDFLRSKMREGGLIQEVMYPDSQTSENYELCRRKPNTTTTDSSSPSSPFSTSDTPCHGPLLSILFHNPDHATLFYNTLTSPKGTSFGTPFSMTLPYVLIVYAKEEDMRWASERGLEVGLVRVCVGWEAEGDAKGAEDGNGEGERGEEDGMELVKEFERALRVVENVAEREMTAKRREVKVNGEAGLNDDMNVNGHASTVVV